MNDISPALSDGKLMDLLNASTSRSGHPGRPVDHAIDHEVVNAVLKDLKRNGYRAITMEGVARQIGRARASLYRRWPSKRHLVAYAVVSELGASPAPDTGSLKGDLTGAVETLVSAFRGALGPALAGLVGELHDDAQLAQVISKEVLATRRRSIRAAFERGVERGEIRTGLDLEIFMDLLTAPFYFRAMFARERLATAMIPVVVDAVLAAAANHP